MKSEFNYPQKVVKEAALYKINPDELAIADLVSCGWPADTAFRLVYRVGASWLPEAVKREAKTISSSEGFKKRTKENRARVMEADKAKAETAKNPINVGNDDDKAMLESVSKENMLLDLVKARTKMTVGSKDWLDVNKMIADLTRMKQDEVKTEDTTVHFYLPIKCHQCSLYIKNKKK